MEYWLILFGVIKHGLLEEFSKIIGLDLRWFSTAKKPEGIEHFEARTHNNWTTMGININGDLMVII